MKTHAICAKDLLAREIAEDARVTEDLLDRTCLDLESLEAIEKCALHQKVITDDVIQASRLESSNVQLNNVNYVPFAVINNMVQMYSTELTNKQIAFDLRYTSSALFLYGLRLSHSFQLSCRLRGRIRIFVVNYF